MNARSWTDVNIEFAHLSMGALSSEISFLRSYEILTGYLDLCKERNEHFSLSILIDDKDHSFEETRSWIVEQLVRAQFNHWEQLVWAAESTLHEYRKSLYELLGDEHAGIAKKIEAYFRKHGRLACSHDIAIWHLIRVGQIDAEAGRIIRALGRGSEAYCSPQLRCKKAVSILSDEDQGYETRAMAEIIRFLKGGRFLAGRIECIYYSVR